MYAGAKRSEVVRCLQKKLMILVFQQLFHCLYNWKAFLSKEAEEEKLFARLELAVVGSN